MTETRNKYGLEACLEQIEWEVRVLQKDPKAMLGEYIIRAEQDAWFNKKMIEAMKVFIRERDIRWNSDTSRRPKKMRRFMVYIDDGESVMKIAVPAYDEEDAREYVQGNGEVIAVKLVTTPCPMDGMDVSLFTSQGYSEHEADFFIRALSRIGMLD